jgi:hypothetical protein
MLLAGALQAAPRLVVVLKTGMKSETDVSTIAKVTFSATAVTVHAGDGKTASTPLAEIQRLHFATGSPVRGASRPAGDPSLLLPDGGGALLRLESAARVEAALLHLDGSRARDLGGLDLPAGSHRLSWAGGTGPALEAGIYLLQVRTGPGAPQRALIRWIP